VWLGRWHESKAPLADAPWAFQAIAVTGHHLEWIALAPPQFRPRRESVERAALALARLIPQQPPPTVANSYAPFSHAARALLLMEEADPVLCAKALSAAGPK